LPIADIALLGFNMSKIIRNIFNYWKVSCRVFCSFKDGKISPHAFYVNFLKAFCVCDGGG